MGGRVGDIECKSNIDSLVWEQLAAAALLLLQESQHCHWLSAAGGAQSWAVGRPSVVCPVWCAEWAPRERERAQTSTPLTQPSPAQL